MDLFSARAEELGARQAPLAARMRPRNLDEFVGQAHVLGPGSALRALIEADELRSVVLWGPPGTGKTTLAQIVARATRSVFEELSATSAGVKDVRAVLAAARQRLGTSERRTILFIDEIHRFNRAQQDALLPGVEDRTVVLVGATTENPFFTVNAPLISRSLLFRLEPLGRDDLGLIVRRALEDTDRGLGGLGVGLDDDALAHLVDRTDGDARHALNALEAAALVATAQDRDRVTLADLEDALQRPRVSYDRAGDQHYDVASAFIKSLRGSDPDAALFWLAKMVRAGEDPRFIARRMVIFASEDIGNAQPTALVVANEVFRAVETIGLPECQFNLAQGVVYLALAPKDRSSGDAYFAALDDVKQRGNLPIPLNLRNAPTRLMKELGYGKGYEMYTDDSLLPEELKDKKYYRK